LTINRLIYYYCENVNQMIDLFFRDISEGK